MLARVRSLSVSRWGLLLAVVAVASVALRAWTYRSVLGTSNADEAIVGLMVRRLVHHGELTAFYWGQAYGGTQEVLLTAPIYALTGTSLLGLRVVPIALAFATVYLVWVVGRRTFGEPAATTAAAVFAVWPALSVWFLTRQQGFYASNVVYCALLLLLALRLAERPDRRRAAVFGLVLGLAFWQTAQIVPVAGGMLGWLAWRLRAHLATLAVVVPLFVLGALPFFAWNALNGWESFHAGGETEYLKSLRLFFPTMIAMAVGLRTPFSTDALVPTPLLYVAYLLLAGGFAYGAYRHRRSDASLLYVVTAVFPFVYALSHKVATLHPRFVVVLTPVLALLVAQLATTYRRAVAVVAVALVLSAATLQRMDAWYRDIDEVTPANVYGPRGVVAAVPRDLGPLIAELDRHGLDRVFADYWLAYRLVFDTAERIVAAESELLELETVAGRTAAVSNPYVRFRRYERDVQRSPHGFVLYRDLIDTSPIRRGLEQRGYEPHTVDRFVVYVPPPAER